MAPYLKLGAEVKGLYLLDRRSQCQVVIIHLTLFFNARHSTKASWYFLLSEATVSHNAIWHTTFGSVWLATVVDHLRWKAQYCLMSEDN